MRRNPFRARQLYPGRLPYCFPPGVGITDLVESYLDNSCRGQIVGQHGTGKSTLLYMLCEELRQRGFQVVTVQLSQSQRKLPSLDTPKSPPRVLIVDGCEQASWWGRRQILRNSQRHGWGLLVSAHHSLPLPTLWNTDVTFATACQIVDALIHLDGLPSFENKYPAAPLVPRDLLRDLLEKHHGNMREVLFALYDWHQNQNSSRPLC